MSRWTAELLTVSALVLIVSSAEASAQRSAMSPPVEQMEPSQPARPRVSPAQWITTDFPENPEHPEEGIVAYRLLIGRDGRPSECLIKQSSGSATLDRGTCALLVRRFGQLPMQRGYRPKANGPAKCSG